MSSNQLLKEQLDRLVDQFDHTYLATDPVSLVHRYQNPADIEVAGLVISSIAYGGAGQIIASGRNLLDRTGPSPAEFARTLTPDEALRIFSGFKHRWTDAAAIASLWLSVGEVLRRYGSLRAQVQSLDSPEDRTIEMTMARFSDEISRHMSGYQAQSTVPATLIPSPVRGSACKRLAMYFRWMVRGPDGIDFGIWPCISPARLIIPVDRHIARMGRRLGLTTRKTDGWKTALDITASLSALDPDDPLRYDFALVRPGITGDCPPRGNGCNDCLLGDICDHTP